MIPALIGAAIGLAATLFVAWPLLAARVAAEQAAAEGERVELLFEKERMLQALKEIDFDHEMGKLTDEDHRHLRADYRTRAVAVLRGLEDDGADLEDAIEADIAKARGGPVAVQNESPGDSGAGATAAPRFCSSCGTGLGDAAVFCSSCGTPIARAS